MSTLTKLLDIVDATTPSTPRDFGSLADDLVVALAAVVAHLPPTIREEELMRLEHGDLREAVMKFDAKLHKSYPRVVSSGGGAAMSGPLERSERLERSESVAVVGRPRSGGSGRACNLCRHKRNTESNTEEIKAIAKEISGRTFILGNAGKLERYHGGR
jgi:hypothetical protein